jgi:hypothetical protein
MNRYVFEKNFSQCFYTTKKLTGSRNYLFVPGYHIGSPIFAHELREEPALLPPVRIEPLLLAGNYGSRTHNLRGFQVATNRSEGRDPYPLIVWGGGVEKTLML